MLVYLNGRMYYSTEAVWATAVFLLAALPVGVWVLRLEQCLLSEEWLAVIDWVLAATLVNGLLTPFLQWNLTPGGGRWDLYALRSASALLTSAALVALCVHSLSRMQLALCNALYVGISLNLASWSSALWLHLQPLGLGGLLLPEQMLRTLRTKPLVQWLRDNYVDLSLLQLRQLAPVLLVPEEHVETALAALPPALRHRLQQPLVAELPQPVQEVVQPWAHGPGHLRVTKLGLPKLALNHKNNHHHNGEHDESSDPSPVPPPPPPPPPPLDALPPASLSARVPEWIYIYALRRHLQTRLAALRPETKRNALLLLAAAAAFRVLRPAMARRLTASRVASLATRAALPVGLVMWALHRRRALPAEARV